MRYDYASGWIVDQTFYVSFDDLEDKRAHACFYFAHAAAFDRVARDIARAVLSASSGGDEKELVTLASANMNDLAPSAVLLLQDFAVSRGARIKKSIVRAGTLRHAREVYQTVVQLWYGSMLQDAWATVVVIRQAIELRIRGTLGILGAEVNGVTRRISVLELIDALGREKTVIWQVTPAIVERIYRWANLYVHTGFREYPWLTGVAVEVLKPLMCGIMEKDGSWSVDNAIRMDGAAERRIQEEIIARCRKLPTDNVQLIGYSTKPRPIAEFLARLLQET
jgi:hypothetical protein